MSPLMRFKEKWCHPDDAPTPVNKTELEEAEVRFGMTFPPSYVSALCEVGALHSTFGLLSVIADQGEMGIAAPHDLSALLSPSKILDQTSGWIAAGMPKWLVAIGNDCMGNSFCFDTRRRGILRKQSQAIYFWDHDFDDTTKIAESFDEWIESYLKLPGNYDSWKKDGQ